MAQAESMKNLMNVDIKIFVIFYMVIDIVLVGVGMGIPIFCILLGFPFGWYITNRTWAAHGFSEKTFSLILKQSLLSASFTCLLMIFIWGILAGAILMLLDPSSNYSNFGHPFILYDPKNSFIGWIILMILISPFLQLLTTIFSSFLTMMNKMKK